MEEPNLSADEALDRLRDGNARFVADRPRHASEHSTRRLQLRQHQRPFAVVLTCSDSRVPPSFIFDAAIGDIFVVRVAGNVAAEHELGSIEYAVTQLGTNLVVVMGHESCGAVSAAVAGQLTGLHIDHLLRAIGPAVAQARDADGDLLDRTVRAHARLTASKIAASPPAIAPLVADRGVRVVPAVYHFATGEVEWLDPT